MEFFQHRVTEMQGFTEQDYNLLSQKIIKGAIEIHRHLGPGLLESVYEICLFKELRSEGIYVKRQVPVPVFYKDEVLDKEFVIDLPVENKIIVESKAVETMLPVHEYQPLTQLKLSGKKLGLLINFNVVLLKEGIRRRINGKLTSA